MFSRVLVANRGEIAVRVIRAVHELGLEAVAVYSTADRDALHVRLADEAVCLGPPAAAESYLRSRASSRRRRRRLRGRPPGLRLPRREPGVRTRLRRERPRLRRAAARRHGTARRQGGREAGDARGGIPLVPGTDGAASPAAIREAAAAIGFPVLLKATAGGGGKGMRLVESGDALDEAFAAAASEADAAFGDGSLYLEKVIAPARHVEIQVLCDSAGNVLTLGERECSIQRRHQKLIEESPSPALGPETRDELEASGRPRVRRGRLRGRRHVRVPARPRGRAVLHRGQLPSPGRASGLRARHGDRCRPRAGADRRGRAARHRPRSPAWPCDRDPDQRGGSGTGSRRRRASSSASGRRWGRACGSTPRSSPGARSRRTTTR